MPRVKQFNEKEVLEKAMNLFWKQGFHATSMQDLVDYLGINRASLYDTFGSKQALFGKALDHYIQTYSAQSQQLLGRKESVKKVIEAFLSAAIRDVIADKDQKGCFVVNSTTELAHCDPVIREKVLGNQKAFLETFEKLFKTAQKKGELDQQKDPRALALSLFIIFSGLRVISKAIWNGEELNSVIEPVLTMLD